MSILQEQIKNSSTSQSYLLSGPKGSKKNSEAMEFANALASEFDIQTLNPEGARRYLANQIREIVRTSSLSPISGKKKVYILHDVEKLGTAAANAFLKTLEEPPNFVTFILLTSNEDNVLPTIVSRCQLIKFKALPTKEAIELVKTESGADYIDAKHAVELYGGDTDKAIEYLLNQDMQDLCDEINYTLGQEFNEWETLEKSKDIVAKIKEICEAYKNSLNDDMKKHEDTLDNHALKEIEKQNKRAVTAKQTELLYLFCAVIKQYFKAKIISSPKYIKTINAVAKYEAKLAYNISLQNFIDCVLLKVKEV